MGPADAAQPPQGTEKRRPHILPTPYERPQDNNDDLLYGETDNAVTARVKPALAHFDATAAALASLIRAEPGAPIDQLIAAAKERAGQPPPDFPLAQ